MIEPELLAELVGKLNEKEVPTKDRTLWHNGFIYSNKTHNRKRLRKKHARSRRCKS